VTDGQLYPMGWIFQASRFNSLVFQDIFSNNQIAVVLGSAGSILVNAFGLKNYFGQRV
jgi:hypothetical protein